MKTGKFVLIGIGILIFIVSLIIPKFIPYSGLKDAYFWIYSTIAQTFAAMIALVAIFVVLAMQIWRTSRFDLIKEFRELIKRGRAYAYIKEQKLSSEEERSSLLKERMSIFKAVAEDLSDITIIDTVRDWVEKIQERHKQEKKRGTKTYGPAEERLLHHYRILKKEENAYNKIMSLLKTSLLWSGCVIGFSFVMLLLSEFFISTWWNFSILVNVLGWAGMGIFIVIGDVWTILNVITISIKPIGFPFPSMKD